MLRTYKHQALPWAPIKEMGAGFPVEKMIGQFEGASSVLTIERAKAAYAAQLPLTLPFQQAALVIAVL